MTAELFLGSKPWSREVCDLQRSHKELYFHSELRKVFGVMLYKLRVKRPKTELKLLELYPYHTLLNLTLKLCTEISIKKKKPPQINP